MHLYNIFNSPLLARLLWLEFESLAIGKVYVRADNYVFKFVNPYFLEKLGYSRHEVVGRPFTDFVHREDLEHTLAKAERMVTLGETSVGFRNRYRRKDGSYVHISWQGVVNKGYFLAQAIFD